jgi:hypothetical protein
MKIRHFFQMKIPDLIKFVLNNLGSSQGTLLIKIMQNQYHGPGEHGEIDRGIREPILWIQGIQSWANLP